MHFRHTNTFLDMHFKFLKTYWTFIVVLMVLPCIDGKFVSEKTGESNDVKIHKTKIKIIN